MGRICLSLIFLTSGAMKVVNWSPTVEHMGAEGMVAATHFLGGAILVELRVAWRFWSATRPAWAGWCWRCSWCQ